MKRIFTLLFLCNAALQPSIAQPTVSTMPKAGDAITSEFAHTTGIRPGATGANITWDYSNLVDSAAGTTTKMVSAAGTPYVAHFPGASLAAVVGDTLYSYIKTTGGVQGSLGLEAANEKAVYAHPYQGLHYPFTYLNSFYEKDTMYFDLNTLLDTTILIDTIKVTGYGTLKLPGNTYTNVLQTMQISVTEARTYIPGFGEITSPASTDTSYAYYVEGQPGSILNYNINSGTIDVITFIKNTALPVHFISFSATNNHSDVVLKWQTGDELNTNVFIVQRSMNGSDFKEIGKISARVEGSSIYSFTDKNLTAKPMVYYRLKETDLDGQSFYSEIITCKLMGTIKVTLSPNPASNQVLIKGVSGYANLKILNLAGRQINSYEIKGESIVVPIATLSPGVYIASLRNGNKIMNIKFIKR